MHIAIVTGSRFTGVPRERVTCRLDELLAQNAADELILFHGGATGVDNCAYRWCISTGVQCVVFPAMWANGKSAGPKRNKLMISYAAGVSLVTLCTVSVEAFPGPSSKGTWDCVNQAKALGIKVNVWGGDG